MKKLTLLLALLLVLPLSVSAQDSSKWQVVVYADGANALQILNASGVSGTIPAGTLPLQVGTFPSAPLVALSPDRSVMAALNFIPGHRLSVSIAAGGSCCQTIRLSEFGVAQANIGGFNPDGTAFDVSYVAPIDAANLQYEAAIITINVNQGIEISRLDGTRLGGDYAILRDWNNDGIGFQSICYNCTQEPSGTLLRWDPVKDTVTQDSATYSAGQDTLDVTGETIMPVRRADYPLPVQSSAVPQPNVVALGDDVIFYDPNNLLIDSAHWVADGWDVLVEQPGGDTLLDRTEQKHPITVDDQFLVGTPDGWLGTREVNGAYEVVHHTLSDTAGEEIARFYHPVAVLQAPSLGATASHGGFSNVTSPVSRITCPNALPPRLVAGGKGRTVTPGVHLRTQPSVTASTISTITNEQFDVISGPQCDPTGIVWWEVGFGSLRGWMAESQGGNYLLEPVVG